MDLSNKSEIMVSICCVVYNHEKYIGEALDSFISQETDFCYEILVHDDASTDGSVDIVREYERKYPQVIKGIYQKENQYSKGIKILPQFILPHAKGKYIAVCEGDDYWCNNNKLKRQVEFMEKNPDYSACVHSSYMEDCLSGKRTIYHFEKEDYDLRFSDICEWQQKRYLTSSLLMRREYMYLPKTFMIKQSGDYSRGLWLGMNGKVHFLKEPMSVYRMNVAGSWTSRLREGDVLSKRQELIRDMIDMLNRVDTYSNYRYHSEILDAIRIWEMTLLEYEGKLDVIWKDYKKEMKKVFPIKRRVSVFLQVRLPLIWKLQHIVRHPVCAKEERKN